jgi:hypothetical protein
LHAQGVDLCVLELKLLSLFALKPVQR